MHQMDVPMFVLLLIDHHYYEAVMIVVLDHHPQSMFPIDNMQHLSCIVGIELDLFVVANV